MTIGTKTKKLNVNTYDSMNGPWGRYAKWNKPVTKTNTVCMIHTCEVLRVVKFTEMESKTVVTRGWGGMESYCLMGTVLQD